MKTANCWLIIDPKGSNVPKSGVTPTEVQVLVHLHSKFAGKCAVHDVVEDKEEVTRTDAQEINRLRAIYGAAVITELYGKVNHKLPKTFKEALVLSDTDMPDTGESPEKQFEPVAEKSDTKKP
jgi:hypothetical protein